MAEPCSPSSPRALVSRDRLPGAVSQASVGEAVAQASKRRGSPPVDGDGKRVKRFGNDFRQLQLSNEETQSVLFSCRPTGAASFGKTLDASGSRRNVQQISSFKLERTKHRIFLSHSGFQKDFVEQLCVDLEARGYCFPFFD